MRAICERAFQEYLSGFFCMGISSAQALGGVSSHEQIARMDRQTKIVVALEISEQTDLVVIPHCQI